MSRLLDKSGKQLGRVGTRVATLGHALQLPHKFQFDFKFSKAEMVPKNQTCLVIIERRDKIEATRTFKADNSKTVLLSDTLSMSATLFRKDDKEEFEPKKAKIAIRLGRKDGKTVSKIHIDLAKYANVPNGEVEVKLKMTGGAIVFATIVSRLIKAGRGNGPSSLFSAVTTGSGGLGNSGDLDDLDDLDLGDDDDFFAAQQTSVVSPKPQQAASVVSPSGSKTSNRTLSAGKDEDAVDKIERLTRENVRMEEAIHRGEREIKRLMEDIEEAKERLQVLDDAGADVVEDANRQVAQIAKKMKDLEASRQELEETSEKLEAEVKEAREIHVQLKEELAQAKSKVEEDTELVRQQNERLKEQVDSARIEVSRELKAADLTTEIQIAQVQLQKLQMEKQDAMTSLQRLQAIARPDRKQYRSWLWFKF
eukprot:Plantae.Rhodophyta-Purpureofilum_apyrenoidigerum.ctg5212.p1 GENE.Plantae.Rhodophyta-Purpureofilum_apyrenoidigerum.ctg5212~~Plantae.Rhodophyta-Purpureofilum_apyrenoidigerum.ctg5212.p1  ORF type:complete len:423 (+),score=114.77 Plantae.Rhodophyta-Purpureofilum_apyrenoidigerum.ctg5212:146-1414(+)